MKRVSGLRTLLVIVLLFTMLSAVNSFELFNETLDYGFLMENKIDVQEEVINIMPVDERLTVYSVNYKQQEIDSFYNLNNDGMFTVSCDNLIGISTNFPLSYAENFNVIIVYTDFKVDNVTIESNKRLTSTSIDGSRGDYLHFADLGQQI